MPMEEIFDIMSDLPDYSYNQRRILPAIHPFPLREEAIMQHVSRVQSSLAQLDQWLARFDLTRGPYRIELPYSRPSTNAKGEELAWSTYYRYNRLPIANSVCHYHGTKLHLYARLIEGLPGRPFMNGEYVYSQLRASAFDVCQSADSLLSHAENNVGALFLIYPLKMAMRAFQLLHMDAEVTWIREQFGVIASRRTAVWELAKVVVAA